MKDRILYIGDFKLIDCDASAVRVRGVADILGPNSSPRGQLA